MRLTLTSSSLDGDLSFDLSKSLPKKEGKIQKKILLEGDKKVSVYLQKNKEGYLFHLGALQARDSYINVLLNNTPINVWKKGESKFYRTPCFLIKNDGTIEEIARNYFRRPQQVKNVANKSLAQLAKFKEKHPEIASYVDRLRIEEVVKNKGGGKKPKVSYGYSFFEKKGKLIEEIFSLDLVKTAFDDLLTLIAAGVVTDIKDENIMVDQHRQAHLLGIDKSSSKQDVSQVEKMLSDFCKSFCDKKYGDVWDPAEESDQKLFEAMQKINEEPSGSKEIKSSLEKQLRSLAQILKSDDELVRWALKAIKPSLLTKLSHAFSSFLALIGLRRAESL